MGIFLCQVKVGFPETLETSLNPSLVTIETAIYHAKILIIRTQHILNN